MVRGLLLFERVQLKIVSYYVLIHSFTFTFYQTNNIINYHMKHSLLRMNGVNFVYVFGYLRIALFEHQNTDMCI